jgi:hypothetical protein
LILRKVFKTAAAVAAVATAVGASLVAAAFALYALLEGPLGRPGAAAIVALILALVAAIVALVMTRKPRQGRHRDEEDLDMPERLIQIARTKPILTAAAAAAAGLIAWRNPALVGVIAAALMKKPDRDR